MSIRRRAGQSVVIEMPQQAPVVVTIDRVRGSEVLLRVTSDDMVSYRRGEQPAPTDARQPERQRRAHSTG